MLEKAGFGNGRHMVSIENARTRCSAEYARNFWAIQRLGKNRIGVEVHNALTTGTSSEGGFLVPLEFDRMLVMKEKLYNEIRTVASVITTAADVDLPLEESEGTAAWMTTDTTGTPGEHQAYPESDSQFGRVTLKAYKLGRIMKVSEELMQDSFFDMPNYIADAYGRSFGLAEEEAFVAGDGTAKPQGVLVGASVGVTAAGQTAITSDELLDLFYSLNRPYRAQARWLASDQMIKLIHKLKDNDGQYLWQPGLQGDEPDRILGHPVIASSYVPNPAAGVRSLGLVPK